MTEMTDKEFCAKLSSHFAMYRLNLRSPLVKNVNLGKWYRVEVFLVNEIGLYRRADMEPDGRVYLGCDLVVPNSPTSLTPLTHDPSYALTIRPSTWAGADATSVPNTGIVGFCNNGKGSFEYSITRKHSSSLEQPDTRPRYLRIYGQRVENFPKYTEQLPNSIDDWLQPLVVGPIQISPIATMTAVDSDMQTNISIERWPPSTLTVHSVYRLFSSPDQDHNVAIHESWESGIPGKIWDSALVMLQMLDRMKQYKPDYINGKHILDLSAGTGLLGLCVVKDAQPSKVTITEIDEATDLIRSNVSLNSNLNSRCPIEVRSLLWGDSAQASACGKVDLILASDVLYEAEFFDDLVKTFLDLCSGKIYIGYKRRGFDVEEENRFWGLCQEHFDTTLLNDNPTDEDACLVPPLAIQSGVKLYRLTLLP